MDLTPPIRLSDSLEFLNDPTVRDKILENLKVSYFHKRKKPGKNFATPPSSPIVYVYYIVVIKVLILRKIIITINETLFECTHGRSPSATRYFPSERHRCFH